MRHLFAATLLGLIATAGWPVFAAGQAASTSAAAGPANGLVITIRIPLKEGKLELGELMGHLVALIGGDEAAVRDKIRWSVDVNGPMGRLRLRMVQNVTREVMTFAPGPGQLVVRVDRLKLRQHEKRLRLGLRLLMQRLFPEAAAAAEARYGLSVYQGKGQSVPPVQATFGPNVVVLVHGLDDPGKVWCVLAPALAKAGYTPCVFTYPNDQSIVTSAGLLAEHLQKLRRLGVRRVSLVTHSMGGLLGRELLTSPGLYNGHGTGRADDPTVDRFIMVGTPNHGSSLARFRLAGEVREQIARALSGEGLLFGAIFDGTSEAKIDLLPDSAFLATLNGRRLPQDVAVTIIAGNASPVSPAKMAALKPWLRAHLPAGVNGTVDQTLTALSAVARGVGDGAVSLASTRLEGVQDHVIVPGNHLSMIRNVLPTSKRIPPAVPVILDRLSPRSQPAP